MLLIYAIAFAYAPNISPRRLTWISPGAGAGSLIWLVASAGFFFYVSNFGKYGATYGAFAGAVILLLWLYLSNIAFLFGAELNAQLERERQPVAGGPPPLTPQPPPEWPPAPQDAVGAPALPAARVDDKYGRDALAPDATPEPAASQRDAARGPTMKTRTGRT